LYQNSLHIKSNSVSIHFSPPTFDFQINREHHGKETPPPQKVWLLFSFFFLNSGARGAAARWLRRVAARNHAFDHNMLRPIYILCFALLCGERGVGLGEGEGSLAVCKSELFQQSPPKVLSGSLKGFV